MASEFLEILDHIDDLISIHDKDFTIAFVNKAFARHAGRPREEIIGEKCYRIIHGSNLPIVNCPHRQTLAVLRPTREVVHDPKSGRTLSVSTYPYYAQDGTFAGSVHVARDITAEREQLLRLVVQDRGAALDEQSVAIRGELREPLEAIGVCAARLLETARGGDPDPDSVEIQARAVARGLERSEEILGSFRMVSPPPDPLPGRVGIHELIDSILATFADLDRLRGVTVKKYYGEGDPALRGSAAAVRQVLTPVVANALDAMGGQGTLGIVTAVHDGTALIDIADSGPGIAPENIERIFKPFFTTREERGGTGLGLSVARAVVEGLQGQVAVLSSFEGEGTTFRVSLPLSRR